MPLFALGLLVGAGGMYATSSTVSNTVKMAALGGGAFLAWRAFK